MFCFAFWKGVFFSLFTNHVLALFHLRIRVLVTKTLFLAFRGMQKIHFCGYGRPSAGWLAFVVCCCFHLHGGLDFCAECLYVKLGFMLRDSISVVVSQINRTPFIHSQSARWWMSDYRSVVLSQDRINSITSHEYIVTVSGMGSAEIIYNPCTVTYRHLTALAYYSQ